MATEFSRTTARKTIVLPSGDKIKVPVITQISFIDPVERYQETQHTIDNSSESNRKVHVDQVHPVDVDENGIPTEETPIAETSKSLYVERIDTWNALDATERAQETQLTLDNVSGNDLIPPHFSTHIRTHIYRYFQDPNSPDDNGVWVDSEWIDEFAVIDPVERYQETHYTLINPTNQQLRDGDLSGQASDSDPDITITGGEGEGTQANPVRLDPFQNIVNYSSGTYVLIQFIWNDPGTTAVAEGCFDQGTPSLANFTFYPGIQATFNPTEGAAIGISFAEDRSHGAICLNLDTSTSGDTAIVITPAAALGYAKFGPTCQPCLGTSAPIGCTDIIHADPVPFNQYLKSYLFDASASVDQTDPTLIAFDLTDIPGPKNWLSGDVLSNPPVSATTLDRRVLTATSQLLFNTWVFKKSDVDLFLSDPSFPLRLKGGVGTVDQTKAKFSTRTSQSQGVGWADPGHMVHEQMELWEPITGDNPTGVATDNVLDFRFEKLTLNDGKHYPLAWPENPPVIITDVVSANNVDGPPVPNTHIRQYFGTAKAATGTNPVFGNIDFGVAPDGVTA